MSASRLTCVVLVAVFGLTGVAGAQTATTGNIVGVVRDTSGGVLPGVTVEVTGAALIDKLRTGVTDDRGQYRIVDLPPGSYDVTFTLAGFGALKRQGIELTSGFTASVNPELTVGSVEETVTVSGASPMVDVQNVQTQNVLKREHLDSLPSGRTIQAYAALTLGMLAQPIAGLTIHDVGGNKGEIAGRLVMHGSRINDQRYFLDGMATNNSDSATRSYFVNQVAAQEINITADGVPAESMTSGVQMNVIPRSGGNIFSGYFTANYSGENFQSDRSLDDELIARGVTTSPSIRPIFDLGGGVGGPLKQDKLWFYGSYRYWGSGEYAPGNYFNSTPHTLFYTPDYSRPAYTYQRNRDNGIRITWQATQKQRFTFFGSTQQACNCFRSADGSVAPEATQTQGYYPSYVQAAWTYPATTRLMMEVGTAFLRTRTGNERGDENAPGDISVRESLGTATTPGNFLYGAAPSYSDCESSVGCPFSLTPSGRASITYVSGAHSFKTGFQWLYAISNSASVSEPPFSYTFRAGLPSSVTYLAQPSQSTTRNRIYALYAQDQWTLRRVTLNYGVRFDANRSWYPAQTRPGGQFVGPIDFAALDDVPNWKDISPRFGAAWNIFGNGKTAIKGFVGRYIEGGTAAVGGVGSPAGAIVTSATRTWTDDGDFIPQERELGPLSPATFGTSAVTTRVDPELLEGWWVRPFNWESSVSLQHELRPGLSLTTGYYHRTYANQTTTDNLMVTPGDFDPYCVTVPVDARLPDGGGNQLCGLYDLKPALFGLTDNFVTFASNFGKVTEVYNGFDLGLNARFGGRGGMVGGGVSSGSTTTDDCSVRPDSPDTNFCSNTYGFKGQTQVKLQFLYPLPGNFEVSGVYQNLAGIPVGASGLSSANPLPVTRAYTNNEIAPSLGRNLAACGVRSPCTSSVSIAIMKPNQVFENRLSQLDLRLTKAFRFGRNRLQARFDAYNIFNNAAILAENFTYGSTFLKPTSIVAARLFKVGAQFDF